MVILRLTNPVSSEFEYETSIQDAKGADKDAILVRPCERYKDMHSICRSIKGRVHQYYVYGELSNCDDFQRNYENCMSFRSTKDTKSLDGIIKWEKELKAARLSAERANTAWKFRDNPPEDFDSPLPEYLAKRQRETTFQSNTTP